MTRKSTPKYVVKYGEEIVYGPASKTDCKRVAVKMGQTVFVKKHGNQ
jgi:hypothetical protein